MSVRKTIAFLGGWLLCMVCAMPVRAADIEGVRVEDRIALPGGTALVETKAASGGQPKSFRGWGALRAIFGMLEVPVRRHSPRCPIPCIWGLAASVIDERNHAPKALRKNVRTGW